MTADEAPLQLCAHGPWMCLVGHTEACRHAVIRNGRGREVFDDLTGLSDFGQRFGVSWTPASNLATATTSSGARGSGPTLTRVRVAVRVSACWPTSVAPMLAILVRRACYICAGHRGGG